MLQFGIFDAFENFIGADTLLIWGDRKGLGELHATFSSLAEGGMKTAALDEMPWATSVAGDRLRLSVAATGYGRMQVTTAEDGRLVDWSCSPTQLADFADKVRSLADASSPSHQYLDAALHSCPLQVMVSRGEYPDDLRPKQQSD